MGRSLISSLKLSFEVKLVKFWDQSVWLKRKSFNNNFELGSRFYAPRGPVDTEERNLFLKDRKSVILSASRKHRSIE